MEVRYYKGERIPLKPHDCTESNTCTFCRREKRRFISALNSHKAQTPMHTPPDKCPKCGAKLEGCSAGDWVFYECGTRLSNGSCLHSDLCLMTQRAQNGEERAEKWKKVATIQRDRIGCGCGPDTCVDCDNALDAYDKLLSEEQ